MSRKLPVKYKVPRGNVLVRLMEDDNFSSMGMSMPTSDKDTYNMWVDVVKVGGSLLYQLYVLLVFGYKSGDKVRTKRSIENPFEGEDGEKYLVIYQEDVNLILK